MSSNTREEIVAAFDALNTAVSEVVGLSFDVLTTPERLNLLERLEGEARRLPVSGYALINQIAEQADETELGARLPAALAERLRITRGEATRRVAEAAELGPRRALTGQPLAPLLTATAQAVRTGGIGGAHVQVSAASCIACPPASMSKPGKKPKPTWPGWPPNSGPTRSPNWPTD